MAQQWDVIVCGAGTAGMPAAIFAARRGARVLLLEHADQVGGTLHLSSGEMSAAGTRLQQDRAIEDHPDRHFADVMRLTRGTADPHMVRIQVDNAADTLHWLLDSGLELFNDMPVLMPQHETYSVPRTYYGPKKGKAALDVIRPQLDAEISKGGVTLRLATEVLSLVQDGTGAVRGVRARTNGGALETHYGSNVVLTTGGYGASETAYPEFSNGHKRIGWCYPYSQGTGLRMALTAGAVLHNQDKFLPMFGRVEDPGFWLDDREPFPNDPPRWYALCELTPELRQPWEIYVNRRGERFVAEDSPTPDVREHLLLQQPDRMFAVVYDSRIARESPWLFMPELTVAQVGKLWNVHPAFARGESLDAVAARLDIDTSGLRRAVGAYNEAVSAKRDPFGRRHLPLPISEPPFYAVRHFGTTVVGFAGIKVDRTFRVIDKSDRPIANLFAAGEILGLGLLSGNCYVGGMSVTPAMTFGRLLGQSILQWPMTSAAR
ncbi:MAG: FAD-dependent oxidoreductase [Alphaproteobacteria bacterium]|nr:FAD-dependent oxidoreductase [Alphaproteobacteria bacterium]